MTHVGPGRAGAWGKGVVTPLLKILSKEGWVHLDGGGATEHGPAVQGEVSPEGGVGRGEGDGVLRSPEYHPRRRPRGILSGDRRAKGTSR